MFGLLKLKKMIKTSYCKKLKGAGFIFGLDVLGRALEFG